MRYLGVAGAAAIFWGMAAQVWADDIFRLPTLWSTTEQVLATGPATGDEIACCTGRARFESDHEFDDFISPVTNTVWFEDPRSLTQLSGVFINQQIPEDSPLAGGDLQVYGLQAYLALTERLAIIAPKDGFVTLQADAIPHEEGWADIATGFKYVLVRDTANRFLLTGGLVYEWSQGSRDVFQGNGDGVYNFFLSAGKGIGCGHVLAALGWHLPGHGGEESESYFYSLHLDYQIGDGWYPLWELNGIHYTESGNRLPLSVEGGDLINLGASDVAGNDVVTMAVGLAKVFSPHLSLSAAYEFPVTGREDLMDNRATVRLILRY
jgi:hypothetical protein